MRRPLMQQSEQSTDSSNDDADAHIDQMLADHYRKPQEIKPAPWGLIISMATAMATFFAAGAAFVKLLG